MLKCQSERKKLKNLVIDKICILMIIVNELNSIVPYSRAIIGSHSYSQMIPYILSLIML